jgi:hypothetical protein
LELFIYSSCKKDISDANEDDDGESIDVHLNHEDVQVTLTDDSGKPLNIKDIDLRLKLPSKFKNTTFKVFDRFFFVYMSKNIYFHFVRKCIIIISYHITSHHITSHHIISFKVCTQ